MRASGSVSQQIAPLAQRINTKFVWPSPQAFPSVKCRVAVPGCFL